VADENTSKQTVTPQDAKVLLAAVIVVILFGGGLFVLFDNLIEPPLLVWDSKWTKGGIAAGLVTAAIPGIIVLWDKPSPRVLLHFFAFCCGCTALCVVNASGGVTRSPLISLYALIVTGAGVVGVSYWSVTSAIVWAGAGLGFNTFAQIQGVGVLPGVPIDSSGYILKYVVTTIIFLAVGGWAQFYYRSKGVPGRRAKAQGGKARSDPAE
jgi:hypothetical protein